jgi:hypothetical protein
MRLKNKESHNKIIAIQVIKLKYHTKMFPGATNSWGTNKVTRIIQTGENLYWQVRSEPLDKIHVGFHSRHILKYQSLIASKSSLIITAEQQQLKADNSDIKKHKPKLDKFIALNRLRF